LSKSGFSPESISKTRREKSSLLEEHTHVIKSCTDEMKELDIEIRNNDKLMTDAEKEMTKITKSIRGLKNHIEGDLFVINECKKWISIFEKSRKDNHNAEQELQSAISTEEMIKRMKLSQKGERLFMETYQQVVDEMIGKDVRAKVLISAENILLDISNSKQLTDPCASWIKLIAFDFATLLHSMKNNIPALGLLIHNTPRREDILESWYERIFTFPYALERSCGDAPLFQYIVATVSAPPQHLQTKEYVRMKLDPSLGDEGALFKETF